MRNSSTTALAYPALRFQERNRKPTSSFCRFVPGTSLPRTTSVHPYRPSTTPDITATSKSTPLRQPTARQISYSGCSPIFSSARFDWNPKIFSNVRYPHISACRTAKNSRVPPWMRLSRSEEHTSELQSPCNLVCRLLLEKKKKRTS